MLFCWARRQNVVVRCVSRKDESKGSVSPFHCFVCPFVVVEAGKQAREVRFWCMGSRIMETLNMPWLGAYQLSFRRLRLCKVSCLSVLLLGGKQAENQRFATNPTSVFASVMDGIQAQWGVLGGVLRVLFGRRMITTFNMPVSGTYHSFSPSFKVLESIVSLCIAAWGEVTPDKPAQPSEPGFLYR
jgi:hypothetical protein